MFKNASIKQNSRGRDASPLAVPFCFVENFHKHINRERGNPSKREGREEGGESVTNFGPTAFTGAILTVAVLGTEQPLSAGQFRPLDTVPGVFRESLAWTWPRA
jgi:hypothetical protein